MVQFEGPFPSCARFVFESLGVGNVAVVFPYGGIAAVGEACRPADERPCLGVLAPAEVRPGEGVQNVRMVRGLLERRFEQQDRAVQILALLGQRVAT